MTVFQMYDKTDSFGFVNAIGTIKSNANNLCRNIKKELEISPIYLQNSALKNVDYVFLARSNERATRSKSNVEGFALVKGGSDFLYIDVICAIKNGKKLIKEVEKFAFLQKKP